MNENRNGDDHDSHDDQYKFCRPAERERWRGSRDFEAFFILFFLTVPLEGNTLDKLHTPDFISTSPFLKNDMTSPQRRSSKQVPDGSLTIAKT